MLQQCSLENIRDLWFSGDVLSSDLSLLLGSRIPSLCVNCDCLRQSCADLVRDYIRVSRGNLKCEKVFQGAPIGWRVHTSCRPDCRLVLKVYNNLVYLYNIFQDFLDGAVSQISCRVSASGGLLRYVFEVRSFPINTLKIFKYLIIVAGDRGKRWNSFIQRTTESSSFRWSRRNADTLLYRCNGWLHIDLLNKFTNCVCMYMYCVSFDL